MKYKPFLFVPAIFLLLSAATLRGEDITPGIDEHLGDTIPMELTFKDASGKEVQLKQLITKPTVLSLVYFHCPTVCKPLRDGENFIHPGGDNPWGGTTLEWRSPSPPPHENFLEPPTVKEEPYIYHGGKDR